MVEKVKRKWRVVPQQIQEQSSQDTEMNTRSPTAHSPQIQLDKVSDALSRRERKRKSIQKQTVYSEMQSNYMPAPAILRSVNSSNNNTDLESVRCSLTENQTIALARF